MTVQSDVEQVIDFIKRNRELLLHARGATIIIRLPKDNSQIMGEVVRTEKLLAVDKPK